MRDNTTEGVHKHYAQDLKVTAPGSASPYNVATGAGVVYGFPYWNTTNYTASIPTPATGTRYDRIVLQADWSNTAVRIARLGGVAGGTQASLTQTDGVTWEIPLARLEVSTGGVVSVSDKRSFLHPNAEIQLDRIRSLAARSIIGRSANSTGAAAEIVAGTDNRIFARVSNTLGFTQANSAMIGSDSIAASHIARQIPVLTKRVGGSASDWTDPGSVTYSPSGVKMYCGAGSTGFAGGSAASMLVTFPAAYSQKPIVTALTDSENVVSAINAISTSQVSFIMKTRNDQAGPATVIVYWQSIGAE